MHVDLSVRQYNDEVTSCKWAAADDCFELVDNHIPIRHVRIRAFASHRRVNENRNIRDVIGTDGAL